MAAVRPKKKCNCFHTTNADLRARAARQAPSPASTRPLSRRARLDAREGACRGDPERR